MFNFFKKLFNNTEPLDKDLMWFGINIDTGRPILSRVKRNRCRKCKGFGTYGNPLCGAVYTCQQCKGTGHSPSIKVRLCQLYEKIVAYFKSN